MANYNPPGIAGESAGRSSNIQWVFRQLWRKHCVDLHQQCVHDRRSRETARRCSHWRSSWTSTADLLTLTLRTPCRLPWHVTLEDIGRSSLAEIYTSIVLAIEASEGLHTQDRALRVMVVSDCLFEDWMATYHPPRFPGYCPFAVEQASIPFAFEARECPNTQDKARRSVPSSSSGRSTVWLFTCAISAVSPSLSVMLTQPGILSSFESQRLTEDSSTSSSLPETSNLWISSPTWYFGRFRGIFRVAACPPGGEICSV